MNIEKIYWKMNLKQKKEMFSWLLEDLWDDEHIRTEILDYYFHWLEGKK